MFPFFHLAAHHASLILAHYGYLAVFSFIGIESLGIPFPGESMLITASIYAGNTHHLNILFVIIAAALGAIVGDNIGYWIGRKGGFLLLRRFGKYIGLQEKQLKVGQYLFDKYGERVVFFGRFVAILRTWAAFLAGTNDMPWKKFFIANAAGGIVWATFYGVAGFLLGKAFDVVGPYIRVATFIVGMMIFIFISWYIAKNQKRLEKEAEEALPGPISNYRK